MLNTFSSWDQFRMLGALLIFATDLHASIVSGRGRSASREAVQRVDELITFLQKKEGK